MQERRFCKWICEANLHYKKVCQLLVDHTIGVMQEGKASNAPLISLHLLEKFV